MITHNMKKHNNNTKYILFTFIVLLALTFVNAELFVSASIDKKFVYPDEIAFLTIRVYNDSNTTLPQVYLRIEGKNTLFFNSEELPAITKAIEDIKPYEVAETKIKFKVTKYQTEPTPIFVYYGETQDSSEKGLPFVSGTITQTKENKIIVTAKDEKKTDSEGEKVIISMEMKNTSGEEITAIAAETIAPNGFSVKSDPFVQQTLLDKNTLKTTFEILAPVNVDGEQVITLGYGFFDSVGPYYFEKTFKENYTKTNRTLLAVIGLIVLAAAVILYVNRTKGNAVKGSTEKK